MKGYSTRYALTQGIETVTVRKSTNSDYVYTTVGYPHQLRIDVTFFQTPEAAEEAARKMAKRKIASLEKQLLKMKKLAEKPKWQTKTPTKSA